MNGSSTDSNRFNAGDQRSIDHDINNHPGSVFYNVLMDPVGHNNHLKQLKLDTARICELHRLVPHSLFSFRPRRAFCFSFDKCQRMISNCKTALDNLRQHRFCEGSFSIFVEDPSRPNVVETLRITPEDLDILHRFSSASHIPTGIDESTQRVRFLLHKLQQCHNNENNLKPTIWLSYLNILCSALSIGLVSFTTSHGDRFDIDLFNKSMKKIPIGHGLSFSLQELTCVGEFLGSPAWVLGKDSPEYTQNRHMKLSMTIYDFAELWGPIWTVGDNPHGSPMIRSERGFIVPTMAGHDQNPSSEIILRRVEIECHWIQDPFIHLNSEPDERVIPVSGYLLSIDSQILFGNASNNVDNSNSHCSLCNSQALDSQFLKARKKHHSRVHEPCLLLRRIQACVARKEGHK